MNVDVVVHRLARIANGSMQAMCCPRINDEAGGSSMSFVQSDQFRQARRVTIRPAKKQDRIGLRALLWSTLFFIPLLGVIGVYLGLRALQPSRGAGYRNAAKTAIALGLLVTVVQAFVGWRAYQYFAFVADGPHRTLSAGYAGEVSDFTQAFDARAGAGTAMTFLRELEERYGTFVSAESLDNEPTRWIRRPSSPRRYAVRFADATRTAEASFAIKVSADAGCLTSRLDQLTILDPEAGSLVYPVPAPPQLIIVDGDHD
jgi:hypothetical protein